MKTLSLILFTVISVVVSIARANEVQILKVDAFPVGETWHFNVTLKHDDTGWDHYADSWRVVTEDGKVLGTRILYHPHVDEQPFMRGLSEVKIPPGATTVYIEAHDKVDGWSKQRYKVNLK